MSSSYFVVIKQLLCVYWFCAAFNIRFNRVLSDKGVAIIALITLFEVQSIELIGQLVLV